MRGHDYKNKIDGSWLELGANHSHRKAPSTKWMVPQPRLLF